MCGCFASSARQRGTRMRVNRAIQQIAGMKLFQGDSYIDNVFFGESVYSPLHDPMFATKSNPTPDQLEQWRRIAMAIAKAGMPLHVHAELSATIDAFLDQIEAVNKEHPIKNLRWTLAHMNQINASQLERMKKLGMYAAVHPWAVINGGDHARRFWRRRLRYAATGDDPKQRDHVGTGDRWNRGESDASFHDAVFRRYGKDGGRHEGDPANHQPRRRVIAHTRKNAFFVFQEDNLGSIQAGKLADLVVLDRDYLTIPSDQIKDIKPVMTMVGGRIVYEAK